MGATLAEAWEICRILERLDEQRAEQDVARAALLAQPTDAQRWLARQTSRP